MRFILTYSKIFSDLSELKAVDVVARGGHGVGAWADLGWVVPDTYSYITITLAVATPSGTVYFTATILCHDVYSCGVNTPICIYSNGARDNNTAIYIASGSGKQLLTYVGSSVGSGYNAYVRKFL